jgi:hypothetical protein
MLLVIAVVSLSGFDYAVRRERDAASRTRLAGKQPRPHRGSDGLTSGRMHYGTGIERCRHAQCVTCCSSNRRLL